MTHYRQALCHCRQAMIRCRLAMVIARLQCSLQAGNDVNATSIESLQAISRLWQVNYNAFQVRNE